MLYKIVVNQKGGKGNRTQSCHYIHLLQASKSSQYPWSTFQFDIHQYTTPHPVGNHQKGNAGMFFIFLFTLYFHKVPV